MSSIKVAFVSSGDSVTNSANRRPDPYIHDDEYLELLKVFQRKGSFIQEVDWRLYDCNKKHWDFDMLLMRTISDYTRYTDEFLSFLEKIEDKYLVANTVKIIKQNMKKTYLKNLLSMGYPVIESLFLEEPMKIKDIFDTLKTNDVIIKPVIGEGGYGQIRYSKSVVNPSTIIPVTHFAQPMIHSITTAGEISLIFIGGKYSHAVHKVCAAGEYRTQPMHGGKEKFYYPSQHEIKFAYSFILSLVEKPLICRVDFILSENKLLLMEIEAIDAYLYPKFCPIFGERVYTACQNYIKGKR